MNKIVVVVVAVAVVAVVVIFVVVVVVVVVGGGGGGGSVVCGSVVSGSVSGCNLQLIIMEKEKLLQVDGQTDESKALKELEILCIYYIIYCTELRFVATVTTGNRVKFVPAV